MCAEKFHTCGGPRRRPGLGEGRDRRICCAQRLGFWTLQNHCPDIAGTVAAACEKFKAWLVSWLHLIEADKWSLHENSKTG